MAGWQQKLAWVNLLYPARRDWEGLMGRKPLRRLAYVHMTDMVMGRHGHMALHPEACA